VEAFFLPSHLGRLPKIGKKFASSRWLIPVIMGSFLLYMLLYANDHPYNQDLHSVFLRNRILVYFDQTPLLRLAFYFPMAWALACLATVKLRRPEYYLLYPLTVLYLLPSWLIEQRYDLVPFVLFILYTDNHPGEENALAVYGVLFTVLLYVIVATRYLFL
jgi:alpha-1,2-glucosyltransferase